MFHHSILIQKIAVALQNPLAGSQLIECFSQNKDELILVFEKDQRVFIIKADLRPQVSLLSFPAHFSRARKNSVNLFSTLVSQTVSAIIIHPLDRSFSIRFKSNDLLVFKLYGRRSNLLHFQENALVDLFRSDLKQDEQLTYDDFFANASLLPHRLNQGAAQIIREELVQYFSKFYPEKSLEAAVSELLREPTYVLDETKPKIELLESKSINETSYENVLQAVNSYHQLFVKNILFQQEKSKINQKLTRKKHQNQNYINKSTEKIDELKNRKSYREIADVIMANLHQIKKGATQAELFDFYTGTTIQVKLKKQLTPQGNAELLYRKSKNEKIEIEKLAQNLALKTKSLKEVEAKIEALSLIDSWKALRTFTGSKDSQPEEKQLPYIVFWKEGFEIRVGKDAKRNDQLTTRFASKEDIWLHAKDSPGSHVIVRNPAKQKLPGTVLEYSAGLAAYYSKRKADTLCPVLYTERKYVRKSKKLAPGQVIVEREKVILIEPLNPNKT